MMKNNELIPLTTLFLDIGGVMLSNGWGHESRRSAADVFNLDFDEMDERHHVIQVTYEEGKITLSEYLKRVVFYQKRSFTLDQFRDFMFSQSTPNLKMIEYIRQLKDKFNLKIAVVNNEGRELNEHRIQKFKLNRSLTFSFPPVSSILESQMQIFSALHLTLLRYQSNMLYILKICKCSLMSPGI